MGAASKFKDLFRAEQSPSAEKAPEKSKAEVEHLRKVIQEKLRKDPKLGKKAALIIEQMLNQNSNK